MPSDFAVFWYVCLSQKAELGPAVDILPLPKTYEDVERNAVCEIAGWGLTEEGKWSDTLRKVNVTVLSREECHRKWRHKYAITEDMMCTNVGPNREDPCQGDSGSPLICDGVFRAIDSFGDRPCGTPYTTNVFTRLTEKFISWIEETVSDTD
ncbi:granzyme A-like [Mixophyes fleayi]|uniref:granzyme A-like n=1 Tax=Mixophyes fleayi TaxID=3061075 RepID=UPI003F4DF91A